MIQTIAFVLVAAAIVWLLLYMRAQRPESTAQQLLHAGRYLDAFAEAEKQIAANARDEAAHLARADAATLLGSFEEALLSYRAAQRITPSNPASRESEALALVHLRRDLDRARAIMEETIERFPAIQEFQALFLAWIHLRSGRSEEAIRIYHDNSELLQTRFEADYTDRDPLLAETLLVYSEVAAAAGETDRAQMLRERVVAFAPGSAFARMVEAAGKSAEPQRVT